MTLYSVDDSFWEQIFEYWSRPLPGKTPEELQKIELIRENDRKITAKNTAHNIDKMMRGIISGNVSNNI